MEKLFKAVARATELGMSYGAYMGSDKYRRDKYSGFYSSSYSANNRKKRK